MVGKLRRRKEGGVNGWLADAMGEEFRFLHEQRMRLALVQARRAAEEGEVPVGAVIYDAAGQLVGKAWNQTRTLKDPTAHAEVLAITQAASAAGDWRLEGHILYVTKEPCPMCAGAIVLARIPLVVWGVSDPLRGGAVSRFKILQTPELNHRAEVLPGVLEGECAAMLKGFFRQRRIENKGARDELRETSDE
jgi:tRNA(adenine34) deaminase